MAAALARVARNRTRGLDSGGSASCSSEIFAPGANGVPDIADALQQERTGGVDEAFSWSDRRASSARAMNSTVDEMHSRLLCHQ